MTKKSNLTIFAILTTITILTWVGVEAYLRFYKSANVPVPSSILSPFTPNLDTETLENLKQKKQIGLEVISQYQGGISTPPPSIPEESTVSGQTQEGETP